MNNYIPGTTIPKPRVQLSGEDGNAFSIIGSVSKALRRAGAPAETLKAFQDEATGGDYDGVLRAAAKYTSVS